MQGGKSAKKLHSTFSGHSGSAALMQRSKTPFETSARQNHATARLSTGDVSDHLNSSFIVKNDYANAPINEKRYNSTARGGARSALDDYENSMTELQVTGGAIRKGTISVREYVNSCFRNKNASKSELNYQPTDA